MTRPLVTVTGAEVNQGTVVARMTALTYTVDLLAGLGIDPQKLEYETNLSSDPCVTVTFRTLADLESWAKVEKIKIEHVCKSHLQHDEHSALYARPGRRVLAICREFDFERYSRIRGTA